MISPSTGMRSPGRTRSTSPATTDVTGTSATTSPRTTRAVAGCRSTSARNADEVLRFARASKTFPVSTSAMITITAS